MKSRHKRMVFIVVALIGLGIAAALVLSAFRSNMVFFFGPSEVLNNEAPVDRDFRLGGLVLEGSVSREKDGLTTHFIVTDRVKDIEVVFTGILPDLFREGQGVVTEGRMGADGVFQAREVLAKHDETYMPPEVAEALEEAKANEAAKKAAEQTGSSLVN